VILGHALTPLVTFVDNTFFISIVKKANKDEERTRRNIIGDDKKIK
jgi:hypothetical protein